MKPTWPHPRALPIDIGSAAAGDYIVDSDRAGFNRDPCQTGPVGNTAVQVGTRKAINSPGSISTGTAWPASTDSVKRGTTSATDTPECPPSRQRCITSGRSNSALEFCKAWFQALGYNAIVRAVEME